MFHKTLQYSTYDYTSLHDKPLFEHESVTVQRTRNPTLIKAAVLQDTKVPVAETQSQARVNKAFICFCAKAITLQDLYLHIRMHII